jgi:hypothetical protein
MPLSRLAMEPMGDNPRASRREQLLTEHVDALSKELDYAWKWTSPGYTRSTNQRRMKSGDAD